MIKGKQVKMKTIEKPIVNYRKLDALNQSMLKLFDSDPVKFFEEFKMGKKRKDKKNTPLLIGDLVDFYLLECSGNEQEFEARFDEKFALFNGVRGSGQVFTLVDYLFEETENCTNEKGEVTCSFETRFNEAVRKVKEANLYKGKTEEKILEDFNKNGKDYFDTMLNNIGKSVVDISLVDKAKIVSNNLMKDDFTKKYFYNVSNRFTHFPIEFKWKLENGEISCKAELDMMVINHEEKVIQPLDLKTTYDNESFDYMYIKNCYYLQNAFYVEAVRKWAEENEMGDYEIRPMIFVVGDTSSNNRRPLAYITSEEDVKNGMNGFKLRGNRYRGVNELITDIAWAEENDQWKCSKLAFDNKGQLNLNIEYES